MTKIGINHHTWFSYPIGDYESETVVDHWHLKTKTSWINKILVVVPCVAILGAICFFVGKSRNSSGNYWNCEKHWPDWIIRINKTERMFNLCMILPLHSVKLNNPLPNNVYFKVFRFLFNHSFLLVCYLVWLLTFSVKSFEHYSGHYFVN